MPMNSTGFQLKYIRKQMNVSQKAMGELLGISQSGYSEIEQGRTNLSSPAQALICRTYNIDPRIFITDLPESEWYWFLNKSMEMREPDPEYGQIPEKTSVSLIIMEKERIEKELEAYREENQKLKTFIRQHCAEMQ
jgi:transcriptional regulator with XRE-family HTH domain